MSQRTLVLLKPDAVRRGLSVRSSAVSSARRAGPSPRWSCVPSTATRWSSTTASTQGKPFYEPLVEFMASGPVVALVVEGERVIEGVRALAGPTDPIAAAPGSIRGDFGTIVRENLIHASDSEESAEREIEDFLSRLLILTCVAAGYRSIGLGRPD